MPPTIESLRVTLPEANAVVVQGDTVNITWESHGLVESEPLRLSYSADKGQTWTVIEDNVWNTGTHIWVVNVAPGTGYKVRIARLSDLSVASDSTGYFAVVSREAHLNEGTPTGAGDVGAKTGEGQK